MNVLNIIDWIAIFAFGGMMIVFIFPLLFILLAALQQDDPFY